MGALLIDFMYSIGAGFPSQFHAPTVPQVSSGSHLRRYERSPPPVQRSLSIALRTSTNNETPSQDVALILRQQPKEALVTSEGKEKGETRRFSETTCLEWELTATSS